MESDELETPENPGEPDLAVSSSAERVARARRFVVKVDSHSSLLNATRRRQLPGDEQFGVPLYTAGAQPVDVPAARRL